MMGLWRDASGMEFCRRFFSSIIGQDLSVRKIYRLPAVSSARAGRQNGDIGVPLLDVRFERGRVRMDRLHELYQPVHPARRNPSKAAGTALAPSIFPASAIVPAEPTMTDDHDESGPVVVPDEFFGPGDVSCHRLHPRIAMSFVTRSTRAVVGRRGRQSIPDTGTTSGTGTGPGAGIFTARVMCAAPRQPLFDACVDQMLVGGGLVRFYVQCRWSERADQTDSACTEWLQQVQQMLLRPGTLMLLAFYGRTENVVTCRNHCLHKPIDGGREGGGDVCVDV